MKILFISNYYYPYTSGMTVYIRRLAEGLAKKGHAVTVLTSKHERKLAANEKINGVEVVRCPVIFRMQRGSFAPSMLSEAFRLAKKHDAISIHAPMLEAGLIAHLTKLSSKKKPYLTYHCDLKMRSGIISKTVESFYYFSVKSAAKCSEKLIVNSLDYLDSSRLGEFRSKAVGIFPPIDLDEFRRGNNTGEFRKKYGIKEDDKIIGFVGRLVFEKGVTCLVGALPKIMKEFPSAKLVIGGEYEQVAGGGKESVKDEIEKKIKEHSLSNVVLTGHLSDKDLVALYSCCDVLVLPSIDPLESFGMVQVEAMLCGCPVVATDMPGIRVPIQLTGFGLLAPPRDEEKIAECVVEILKNKNGFAVPREKVAEFFGTDKTVFGYEKIFL